MKKEKWRRVINHPRYLISSWGRVFSLKREKILRPYIHKKQMQELIKMYPDQKLDVDHKDRNTLNCNENNLRWLLHSENLVHFHETSKLCFGGKSYRLTKEPKRY